MEGNYRETEDERVLEFDGVTVSVTKEGYGMLVVSEEGEEVERYYGFEMALDHVAELLGVSPSELRVPEEADDMGI
ncbi:MAG: hypothetical protein SV760_05840 [Halobacteria archaeon]|nr:hypothetical protein [Halobacteria archaeon]